MEAFWNSIAAYNAATWLWQSVFIAVAAVLTSVLWFRPRTWVKIAVKVYMVVVSLWIALVYYMKFGAVREYSSVLAIFWCLVAVAWIYDLATRFSTFQKSGKYRPWGVVMLFLPLAYPLISLARGLSFPEMATPMLPSAVALYMLGMLMAFNRKINFFAFIFIVHWAVIAISKIVIFNIPEDILLAVACLPAMFIFFREAARAAGKGCKPPVKYVELLILAVVVVVGACMVLEYV
ncbi:MAG: hypothetical protein IAC23_10360 [Bacteroidetes bacterium]|uniref:Uncharacterized protein n=1 Tax=Candidatus Cryptobacteroides merdavium TaxID=2840769 RepID=A0A9D9EE37_9BACT|nr:hypothetical protein [Candidatus Cryptobacteroides merdavium]